MYNTVRPDFLTQPESPRHIGQEWNLCQAGKLSGLGNLFLSIVLEAIDGTRNFAMALRGAYPDHPADPDLFSLGGRHGNYWRREGA